MYRPDKVHITVEAIGSDLRAAAVSNNVHPIESKTTITASMGELSTNNSVPMKFFDNTPSAEIDE